MAGNRAALAIYAGSSTSDPSLVERLATMHIPTLVLWGDSDQIVDTGYGRAFGAATPTARFQLLSATGHMPQIETPDNTSALREVWLGRLDQMMLRVDRSAAGVSAFDWPHPWPRPPQPTRPLRFLRARRRSRSWLHRNTQPAASPETGRRYRAGRINDCYRHRHQCAPPGRLVNLLGGLESTNAEIDDHQSSLPIEGSHSR